MEFLARKLMKTGADKDRENMIWNMIGSFCYALASMVLSFLVMRIMGDEQGGIFAFAFSVFGQQMFIVAYFGTRPFQITDGSNEYTMGDYLCHRVVTCLTALGVGALYLMFSGYTAEKCVVVFLMVCYKVIDGFADVFESEFQRNGNLHLTGKSNTFRTILSVSVFLIFLTATKNLVVSCMAAVAAQVTGLMIFDVSIIRRLTGISWKLGQGSLKALFGSTFLLFISTFLDFYVFSSAKYAIDAHLNDAASGYFNIIFMPTSVINLVAGFVIRPFLTPLTEYWNRRHFKEFRNMVGKIGLVILGLSVLAVGLTWLIGRPVLGILESLLGASYEGKLVLLHREFTVIVLGGAFYAFSNLLYYALVIMRKQRFIFGIYLAAAAAALILSPVFVTEYGMMGASLIYLLLMILMAVGFAFFAYISYKKGKHSAV
ncbi:MAG: lipopolysaccharide biosynthesis protein [Clostridiaceae bacterium]|nr:lipopolysaccharide biosynthesis protein [Clostridiaceae bacterium]